MAKAKYKKKLKKANKKFKTFQSQLLPEINETLCDTTEYQVWRLEVNNTYQLG